MAAQFQVFSLSMPVTREHKRRKFHSKSRQGCLACKQKKVKCDETHPICRRCIRTNRNCFYQAGNSPESDSEDQEPSQKSLQKRRSGTPLTQLKYRFPLLVEYATPGGGTSTEQLLHHFSQNQNAFAEACLSIPVWHIAWSHPYLVNAILAVSACHLRHHAPNPRPHEVAECYQQRLTLRGFQESLTRQMSQGRSDALIMTAVFLNLLSFTFIEDPRISASWVFSSTKDRLVWLSIQLGLKPLLMTTEAFRDDSALQPMFEASDDDQHTFRRDDVGLDGIPSHWLRLLIPYTGSAGMPIDTIIFREPLRVLAQSRLLEPKPENILLYVQFIGKLDTDFFQLLYDKDNRALWMFGYWLGLLGRFGSWWVRGRVERDYNAIVLYLNQQSAINHGDSGTNDIWQALMTDLGGLRFNWHHSLLGLK
ncbi:Fc.00g058280.m01.CDS01 [Cosmosporella sp. VM-42]